MGEASSARPRVPPSCVHTAWRVHRALHRVSGGRFLWTTSNSRGWGAAPHDGGATLWPGAPRHIGYVEDGQDLIALAMNGWDEGHPAWWLNLEEHPDAYAGRRTTETPVIVLEPR